MIGRIWHGWTTPANAHAYEELLRATILPGIMIAGYHGAHLLRRDSGREVEFVTITWFDSEDAVRAFAGPDGARAVVPDAARALLSRFDERSAHYEMVLAPEDASSQAGARGAATLTTGDVDREIRMLWRRLDHPGFEYLTRGIAAAGPVLRGTVISLPDDEPLRVDYEIACTPDWHTRRALVVMQHGERREQIELACDDQFRWSRDGAPLPSLDGCEDIDLSVTPSTNTLPIHRLALKVGQSAETTSTWIRFPSCDIAPLPQRYSRVAERRYRYESRGGAFTADLEVDEYGMVLDYPPAWERVKR
jgi:hypothetical protein